MLIETEYGCDTGMCMLEVFLETPEECSLDDDGVWRAVRPLLAANSIPIGDVVDIFRRVKDSRGEWVPVFRAEDGNLMWWNDQGERIIVHRAH